MMNRFGARGLGAMLLVAAAAAALAAWHSQREVQAAARNFTRVLAQINQAGRQPPPVHASRQSAARAAKGFPSLLDAIAEEALRFEAESRALDGKFRAIDLGDVLSPARLTSVEGIAASRAKVKSLRRLIVERKRIVQSYTNRMEGMLRDAPIPDDEKRHALDRFEQDRPRAMRAYRDQESAQKTVIARTSAILDFARQNLGSAVVRDGQLHFKAKARADQYNLLVEQLRRAAAAEETAMENTAAVRRQAVREAEQALTRLAS